MILFFILISAVLSMFGLASIFQKKALIPDLYAHAAFPGVVLAYICWQTSNLFILSVGAIASVMCFKFLFEFILRKQSFSSDTVLSALIASSFSVGILLVNVLQNLGISTKFDFSSFLFGNIAAISNRELIYLSAFFAALLLLIFGFRRFFILYMFDPEQFALRFVRLFKIFDACFVCGLVLSVVLVLKVSGVVLTTGLFLIPISIALFGSKSVLGVVSKLTLVICVVSVFAYLCSVSFSGVSTGPILISAYFLLFVFPLCFVYFLILELV